MDRLSRPSTQQNNSPSKQTNSFTHIQLRNQLVEISEKANECKMSNQQKPYDWWSEAHEERWRVKSPDDSLIKARWTRAMSNANGVSEEEEATETLQRHEN